MTCSNCALLQERIDALKAELDTLRPTSNLKYGPLEIEHIKGGVVYLDGAMVYLQRKPREVLLFLAQRPNRTCTNREIQLSIWGTTYMSNQNVVEAVRKIRVTIGRQWIDTIPAAGFAFRPQR